MTDRDLYRLDSAIAKLATAIKLARRKGGTLLRIDVEEALRSFTPAQAPTAVEPLVHYHGPSATRFILIDPTRVTFNVAVVPVAVGSHLDGRSGTMPTTRSHRAARRGDGAAVRDVRRR